MNNLINETNLNNYNEEVEEQVSVPKAEATLSEELQQATFDLKEAIAECINSWSEYQLGCNDYNSQKDYVDDKDFINYVSANCLQKIEAHL